MIYIVCLITAVGVLALDLITKYFAQELYFNFVVIPELVKFKLTYNTGAAFSFLSDKSWAITLFAIITFIALALILGYFIFNIIKRKKVSKWLLISLSLIFAGALGNLIDRLMLGKVRDFIFVFYNTQIFPAIFNVADMALVIGVIMTCIYLLFLDKDAVFRKPQKAPEKICEDKIEPAEGEENDDNG